MLCLNSKSSLQKQPMKMDIQILISNMAAKAHDFQGTAGESICRCENQSWLNKAENC